MSDGQGIRLFTGLSFMAGAICIRTAIVSLVAMSATR
jgi:hypothetical protein